MNQKKLEEKVREEKSSTFPAIRTFFRSNFFPRPQNLSLIFKSYLGNDNGIDLSHYLSSIRTYIGLDIEDIDLKKYIRTF